jgi:hypothetical protein
MCCALLPLFLNSEKLSFLREASHERSPTVDTKLNPENERQRTNRQLLRARANFSCNHRCGANPFAVLTANLVHDPSISNYSLIPYVKEKGGQECW